MKAGLWKYIIGIIGCFTGQLFGILFAVWQWDIIVTGCVWWEASPTGVGWAWPGPGAYARAPFQCWLWRTTIGSAYDTLLFLIFVSAIVPTIVLLFILIRMRRHSVVEEAREIIHYAEEIGTDEDKLTTLKDLLAMEEE